MADDSWISDEHCLLRSAAAAVRMEGAGGGWGGTHTGAGIEADKNLNKTRDLGDVSDTLPQINSAASPLLLSSAVDMRP